MAKMRTCALGWAAVMAGVGLCAGRAGATSIVAEWDANSLPSNTTSVSAWTSTNGNFTLTASGTAQPTYSATGMNNHAAVVLNGTSTTMKLGSALTSTAQTIIAVNFLNTGSPNIATLIGDGTDNHDIRRYSSSNYFVAGTAGNQNDFYDADNLKSANDQVYVDNVLSNSGSTGAFTYGVGNVVLSQTSSPTALSNFWIGSAAASGGAVGRWWNGDVSDVLVFDGLLTSDQRTGVIHNLDVKWGITPVAATQAQIDAANALGVTVPEPGTLALLGIAAVGLLGGRRRGA